MSIYTPRAFSVADEAAVTRLIDDHPFATLITPGATEPQVSHVPLQYRAAPGKGVLLGHMARANPHWQQFAGRNSVAVFHGPHTYVSPSWYTDPAHAVPTWNYAIAHVHGVAEPMTDPAETRALLDDLVARYEGGRAKPWHLQLEGRELAAMLDAIVGFRLTIERIDAKFKLSQNRSADDRERVITALRGEPYAESVATADWMERYAPPR
jgi:transcriptional regulator